MCFFGGGSSYKPPEPQVNPAPHPLDQSFLDVVHSSGAPVPGEMPAAIKPKSTAVPLRNQKTGLTFQGV